MISITFGIIFFFDGLQSAIRCQTWSKTTLQMEIFYFRKKKHEKKEKEGKNMWSELVTCQQFHKFISAVEIMKNSKKFGHPKDCMFSERERWMFQKKNMYRERNISNCA